MIVSFSNGSASLLVVVIGFSEFLAFQPMINMNYTPELKKFFKGISGLNYQMYQAQALLEGISLPTTRDKTMNEGFVNAGIDSASFILNTADVLLVSLTSFLTFFIYKGLVMLFKRLEKQKFQEYFEKKLIIFKGKSQTEVFISSFMMLYLCSIQNIYFINASNFLEVI